MTPNKYNQFVAVLVLGCLLFLTACTVTRRVEVPPGSGNFQDQAQVDPRLTATLDAINAGNEATRATNPFYGLIALATTTVGGVASWLALRKNSQLSQSNRLLTTVIQGVDQAANGDVKVAIQKHATLVGVEGQLSQAVAKVSAGNQL